MAKPKEDLKKVKDAVVVAAETTAIEVAVSVATGSPLKTAIEDAMARRKADLGATVAAILGAAIARLTPKK